MHSGKNVHAAIFFVWSIIHGYGYVWLFMEVMGSMVGHNARRFKMISLSKIFDRAGKGTETDAQAVSSIYIWSKNFSHSANSKVKPEMADIDVQNL